MKLKIRGAGRFAGALVAVAALALGATFFAGRTTNAQSSQAITLHKLSSDTFTNTTSQHATQVEPDTFSFGSTIVSAFQSGRFTDGGSSDIGFATSTDGGSTWTNGFLPGITNIQGTGNPYDRVSDPAVAYDPKHGEWLIATLPIVDSGAAIPAVIVSQSTDGINWGSPVSVTANVPSSDKDWVVCDTWSASPYYGNCYVEWDNPDNGDQLAMSTSTDGGSTWGPTLHPGGSNFGLGGQPVVQPNGTVVVPYLSQSSSAIGSFVSTNGGTSWSTVNTISSVSDHAEAGGLRSLNLPSATVDGGGTVYVVWQDCRFRTKCAENDIILSTSTNGTTWSAVARIPADPTTSTVDHFIPGIDAEKTTSGSSAHLGLSFYYYPVSSCTQSTCQLNVEYMGSLNGGSTWTAPVKLAGPMKLNQLPSTTSGLMVGDYISDSFVNGKVFGVFAVSAAKVGTKFNEAMYTTSVGLNAADFGPTFSSADDHAIPNAKSDHGPRTEQEERGRKGPPLSKLVKKAARK